MRSLAFALALLLPSLLASSDVVSPTEGSLERLLARQRPSPLVKRDVIVECDDEDPVLFVEEEEEPTPSSGRMVKRAKKLGEGKVPTKRQGHGVGKGAGRHQRIKKWVWGTSIIQDPTGTETAVAVSSHTTPGMTMINPFEPTTSSASVFSPSASPTIAIVVTTSAPSPSAPATSTSASTSRAKVFTWPFVGAKTFDETLAPGTCPGVFVGQQTKFICTCLSTESASVFVSCVPATSSQISNYCAGTAQTCLATLCPTGTCNSLELTGSLITSGTCGAGTSLGYRTVAGCGCYADGTSKVTACGSAPVCVSEQVAGSYGSCATTSLCLDTTGGSSVISSAVSSLAASIASTSSSDSSSTTEDSSSAIASSPASSSISSLPSPTPPDSIHTWTLLPYGTTSIWVEELSPSTPSTSTQAPPGTTTPAWTGALPSSAASSTASAAPATVTCAMTADCDIALPSFAHQRCHMATCTFGCNAGYEMNDAEDGCIPHPTSVVPSSASMSDTSSASATASAVSATATCTMTVDCNIDLPAHAHQRCQRGVCTFGCNKNYSINSAGDGCDRNTVAARMVVSKSSASPSPTRSP